MKPVSSSAAGRLPDTRGVRVPERTLPLLRDLVELHTGMFYSEDRLVFLQDRVSALAVDRGFDSLLDYYYLLKYDDAASEEWARVMDALSVQETYFYREWDQVRALAETIVPQLIAMKRLRIRIWSVPCATGEEPLSIAMALLESGAFERVAIEIHASDASRAALDRVATRRYSGRSFRTLPDALRLKYFSPEADGAWRVNDDLFERVTSWTRVNLAVPAEALPLSNCDVIFCRNLFIYFSEAGIRQVIGGFAARMPSPGYLCIGASESLLRLNTSFDLQSVGGAYVYVKQ